MKDDNFALIQPNIENNALLREPQKEGFLAISNHYNPENTKREIGIVLPVGCGKSGLITLTPFAIKSKRTLVIAPNLNIKEQLYQEFNPSNLQMFYQKCKVIDITKYPEPAKIEGKNTNKVDLEEADVVVTNIQQIQGTENKWLNSLSSDFFDLILVDEAHHNVADSWSRVRSQFPNAKIVNFSATPSRADGQSMEGEIIYSYPIFKAIENGFVKRLTAKVLNPTSLKYVRKQDGQEIEVSLDEVIRLGEEDADFRRSIVSSEESLSTIIDCSIRELNNLRNKTSDNNHKIIASALNYTHCIQITEAYRARDLRADYIHSREDSKVNSRILEKLDNHELDVIVQVRKLGEGFDHPYLSIATVCSIFSHLSPFAQFVGRVMRVIDQNDKNSLKNQGVVIYHAGSNIARRWSDFQEFSEADQDYFDQLLPVDEVNFTDNNELTREPYQRTSTNYIEIREQDSVTIEELPLLKDDIEALKAVELLRSKGYDVKLSPIPVTKQKRRIASKTALDDLNKIKTGEILSKRNINSEGKELDKNYLGKTNFVIVKSAIDRKCNELIGRSSGQRHEFTQHELDNINENLDSILATVEMELFNGKA
jgi:superfamily II DNA or RNA helicase